MAQIKRDKQVHVIFCKYENNLNELQKYIRSTLIDDSISPETKSTIIEEIIIFQTKRGPILGNFTLTHKGKTYYSNAPIEKREYQFSSLYKYICEHKKEISNYNNVIHYGFIYYYFHLPCLNLYNDNDYANLITKLNNCSKSNDVLEL